MDQIAEDGTRRGDQIPGSRLVREFCAVCGGAMRVVKLDRSAVPVCTDCDGPPPAPGTRQVWRQKQGRMKTCS